MHYIIGIDDTDNKESRGTGRLARDLSAALAKEFTIHGIVRHQLLEDPRVPKTSHNSSASILMEGAEYPLGDIATYARHFMLGDFQPGSDPGLCVARDVPPAIVEYGLRAQREFVYQEEPRTLADKHGIYLEGLGGTQDGVIGALASVGLAYSGNDGRYIFLGSIRDVSGTLTVAEVLATGIVSVQTLDGHILTEGKVLADKLRPARRNGVPILFVEKQDDLWLPLKLN